MPDSWPVEVLEKTSSVPQWTGREVRALREARRMSVREFAAHLGVSDRMVSKWEAGAYPRKRSEELLDTALRRAPNDAKQRFFTWLFTHHRTVAAISEPGPEHRADPVRHDSTVPVES